jgi:hypothetical protein
MRALAAFTLLLAVSGCAKKQPVALPPPPPPPPVMMPPPPPRPAPSLPPPPTASIPPPAIGGGGSPPMAIATRIFLAGNEPVPGQFGAVAVLIFPSGADPARMQNVCRAFVAVLDDSDEVSERLPNAAQMVTIWPVRPDSAVPRFGVVSTPAQADRLCAAAVANYDLLRVRVAMAGLPAAERLAPATRGPLLAAWAPGADFGRQHVSILRYDLSGIAGQQRLIGAMQVWKDKIERQPELWQSGWNTTKVRLWLSTQVDELGAQIGAAMKLVNDSF